MTEPNAADTRYTDSEGNPILPLKPGVSREAGQAVMPRTLAEANQLLEMPWFRRPAGPWPEGAYVETREGPIRWDEYTQLFVGASWPPDPAGPQPDPLEITEQIFGPLPIAPNLTHLHDHPYLGDGRLSGTFQLGEYVLLLDRTQAHYTRLLWFPGPAPEPPANSASPRPHDDFTYVLDPRFDPNSTTYQYLEHDPDPHSIPPHVRQPGPHVAAPDPSTYERTTANPGPSFTRRFPTP